MRWTSIRLKYGKAAGGESFVATLHRYLHYFASVFVDARIGKEGNCEYNRAASVYAFQSALHQF